MLEVFVVIEDGGIRGCLWLAECVSQDIYVNELLWVSEIDVMSMQCVARG